jgi:hypothetical protein
MQVSIYPLRSHIIEVGGKPHPHAEGRNEFKPGNKTYPPLHRYPKVRYIGTSPFIFWTLCQKVRGEGVASENFKDAAPEEPPPDRRQAAEKFSPETRKRHISLACG